MWVKEPMCNFLGVDVLGMWLERKGKLFGNKLVLFTASNQFHDLFTANIHWTLMSQADAHRADESNYLSWGTSELKQLVN